MRDHRQRLCLSWLPDVTERRVVKPCSGCAVSCARNESHAKDRNCSPRLRRSKARRYADGLKELDMGVNPVRRSPGPAGVREAEAQDAKHRREDLRLADLAGQRARRVRLITSSESGSVELGASRLLWENGEVQGAGYRFLSRQRPSGAIKQSGGFRAIPMFVTKVLLQGATPG